MRSTDHAAQRYAVFSSPRHLLPVMPSYLPQYPILKKLQFILLIPCERPSFGLMYNKGKNYSSVYFKFHVLYSKLEGKRF